MGSDSTPTAWHSKLPTRAEAARILATRDLYYPAPAAMLGLAAADITLDIVWALSKHPAWCVWLWNPRMDFIAPTAETNKSHWVNACVTPLHGACVRAIRQNVAPATLHRIRSGEAVQSPRPRYYGGWREELPVDPWGVVEW